MLFALFCSFFCNLKIYFDDRLSHAVNFWLYFTCVVFYCHVTFENGEQSNAVKMVCGLLLVIVLSHSLKI